MTLSVWRFSHLTLAVISSLFLLLASVTGTILAIDAVGQKVQPYGIQNLQTVNLAQTLPKLRENYLEISQISINHNQFVIVEGLDQDGNEVRNYINPNTGKSLGVPEKESEFIKWITSFHRSLFLHEAGRLFVGINAFLLLLIAFSGSILIIQRQKGLFRFFSKVGREYFAQYLHVITGRLLLIPILVIALSGTYLSMVRFKLFPEFTIIHDESAISGQASQQKNITDFKIFKTTFLTDVQKIEFPFSDEPEEYYVLKLTDRELIVNQFSGKIVSEVLYPKTALLESLSLDLHTGRGNIFLAIILGLTSLSIPFFIYSGFAMTFKRRETQIKNKCKPRESRFVLLAGSENGSTLRFANAVHQQLLANGFSSYLTEMNKYTVFPEASHIIIFTSTHGLGDAPSNADKFLKRIEDIPQLQQVNVSVVGFGSKTYPDFCGYAKKVEEAIQKQPWRIPFVDLHAIDDQSSVAFADWVKKWSGKAQIPLSATPALYAQKPAGLKKMKVVAKTTTSEENQTFTIYLKPGWRSAFTPGDLLAVYPNKEGKERLYSIGKNKNSLQLVVKMHPFGLGSGYLNTLKVGDTIKARIIPNKKFHFPKKGKVVMIANGTGIAPFLGMIEENKKKIGCYLYCGFRKRTEMVSQFEIMAKEYIQKQQLQNFEMAFSREENQWYVTDLIRKDAHFFASLLEGGHSVMICGSLAMQKDVEAVLNGACLEKNGKELSHYKQLGLILTDCY